MFGSKNFWEPIGSHFLRTEFLSKTEEPNRNRTENRMPTPTHDQRTQLVTVELTVTNGSGMKGM